jgi:hypothetical protein
MATEQQLRQALIKADAAGDKVAANLFATKIKGMQGNVNSSNNMVQPSDTGLVGGQVEQRAEPVNEKGFMQGVSDFFSGNDRATPNTQNLPEIGQGGLLFGEDKGKAALITPALLSATDPEEMAKILQGNFENVGIVRDQNGNVFAANNNTGARVVLNKPGLSRIDLIQGLGIASLFTPAGAAQGSLRVASAAGATSAAIEGAQEVSGGDFSFQQVVIDTVAAGLLDKAFEIAKATGRKIKDVLKNDVKIDPDIALKDVDPAIIKATDDLIDAANPESTTQAIDPNIGPQLREASQPNLTPEATAKIQQAEEFGTQITKAQATGDFASSEAEQTLLKSVSSEGSQARSFADQQQEQLKSAAETFTKKFGGSARLAEATGDLAELNVRDKGAQIQAALLDIQDLTRKEVSTLYTQAGDTVGEAIPLDNASIVEIADDIIVNRPITPEVEKSINTALAKFGLIGDSVEKSTRNKFKVMDGDQAITIAGDVTPLTLQNAEAFRTALNKAVGADQTGSAKVVVAALDRQVNDIIEQGANAVTGAGKNRVEAFRVARDAFKDQREKFSAKDVIQDLVGFKSGTSTPMVDPETVITKIVKGDKAVSNIIKIKKILLETPTKDTKIAWRSIQAEAVGDILGQAINKDTLQISGARLNSSMKKYQPEALQELLGKAPYAELKRLQETIGTATIAPPGTTNPSGTFTKFLALTERLGNFAGAGQINFGSLAVAGTKKGKEIAERKATLNGIINTKMQEIKKANPRMSKTSLEQAAKAAAFLQIRELDKEQQ